MVDVVDVGLKLKCPKYGLKESAFYVWYRYSFCFLNFHEEWFSVSFAKGGNKGSTKEWALIVTTTHTLPGNFTQLGILKTDVIHSQWMRARTNMVCLYCQKGETEFLQRQFNTKTVWNHIYLKSALKWPTCFCSPQISFFKLGSENLTQQWEEFLGTIGTSVQK